MSETFANPPKNQPFQPKTTHREGFSEPLAVAISAAERGGAVIMDYFQKGVSMRSKAGGYQHDLVSDADVESERAIAACIKESYPNHAILGEEENAGATDSVDLWVVDPLDGTNNFGHHIPHFAVSIAYYHRGQPVCGVVVNPVRNDWYWAQTPLAWQITSPSGRNSFDPKERDCNAYHNGRRLQVGTQSELAQSMVGVGFYYDRGAMMESTLAAIHSFFKKQIHGVRRFGAAALDLCYVADGQFGVFFEYFLSPWDFAAGRIILEQAGGKITNGRGEPLELVKSSVLATNGYLHPEALEIVLRHHQF